MTEQRTVTPKGDPFYAAIDCRKCGQVPLSEAGYIQQLDAPDSPWRCPKCGAVAEFDDDYYEDHHGITDVEADDDPAF